MASLDIRRLGLGAMALFGASLVFKGVKGKEISKKEEDNLALEIGIDSVMGAEGFDADSYVPDRKDLAKMGVGLSRKQKDELFLDMVWVRLQEGWSMNFYEYPPDYADKGDYTPVRTVVIDDKWYGKFTNRAEMLEAFESLLYDGKFEHKYGKEGRTVKNTINEHMIDNHIWDELYNEDYDYREDMYDRIQVIESKIKGAEGFDAESLRGRWKDGATRIVHGVSVKKTPMAERLPNEKPDYYLSYKGFNARLSYSGVVFNLPCWELYSYGLGKRRQGCFENPMEALLSFKSGVDSVDRRSSAEGDPHDAKNFDKWCHSCGSYDKNPTLPEGYCDECICVSCNETSSSGPSYAYCEVCYEENYPDDGKDYDRSDYYAEDEPLFPGLNCSHCGSDEDTYYGEPLTNTPDGIALNPNDVEAKLHIWCDSCGEASPIEDYDAESFEVETSSKGFLRENLPDSKEERLKDLKEDLEYRKRVLSQFKKLEASLMPFTTGMVRHLPKMEDKMLEFLYYAKQNMKHYTKLVAETQEQMQQIKGAESFEAEA